MAPAAQQRRNIGRALYHQYRRYAIGAASAEIIAHNHRDNAITRERRPGDDARVGGGVKLRHRARQCAVALLLGFGGGGIMIKLFARETPLP